MHDTKETAPAQAERIFHAEVVSVARRTMGVEGYRVCLDAPGLQEIVFFADDPQEWPIGAAVDVTITRASES